MPAGWHLSLRLRAGGMRKAGDVPDDSDAGCGRSGEVGLGLIIQMFRRFQTVDINVLSEMKG